MKKVSVNNSNDQDKSMRPALNPEARDNQLIALSVDLAEKQLREGTASSQVIVHYLKLAANREKTRLENELLKAKTQSLKSSEKSEKLYEEALKAFAAYAGSGVNRQDDQDL